MAASPVMMSSLPQPDHEDHATDLDNGTDGESSDEDEEISKDLSKQKGIHTAIFKAWMCRELRKPMVAKPAAVQHDSMSVGQIMGRQHVKAIINDPRQYQMELFDRAKKENTIAVLDTGSGKTLIAALLLRHTIEQDMERFPEGQHRVAFFLVPSVNLVLQQHSVIENNMDYPAVCIHGRLFPELWTREQWQQIFKDNRTIVCTADILKMCLEHGFISMSRINLLIFDEAHHAKLNHAYSVILNEHYRPLDPDQRPRIFGMTASPVDIKADDIDVLAAARELEFNLHSTIATTSLVGQINGFTHKPQEQVIFYAPLADMPLSPFSERVMLRFGHLSFVQKLTRQAAAVSKHMGSWCADIFWQHALKSKLETCSDAPLERFISKHHTHLDVAKKDQEVAALKEVLAFVSTALTLPPTSQLSDTSHKVLALIRCLRPFFGRPSDCRCIIFVKERLTAVILTSYFKYLTGLYIRPGYLLGVRSSEAGAGSTLRQQILTVERFRDGELNCIFATSVAEEGLDIPSCNIVVRFDPCLTIIQYIQSRGRARRADSHFIHVIENSNQKEQATLEDCQRSEQIMKNFCARIPDEQLLEGSSDILEDSSAAGRESYTTPAGAMLTLSNSMRILATFVSGLPMEQDDATTPQFTVVSTFGGFSSQVFLPDCAMIQGCRGKIKRRKQWAKFSAAFETCSLLVQKGLLDDHLISTIKDHRPALRQAALALNLRASNTYAMRNKPDWKQDQIPINSLHGMLVTFGPLERPARSLILLSRRQFIDFPAFPVFPTSEEPSEVRTQLFTRPLDVQGSDLLQQLNGFTLCMFKDLFNKTYENTPEKMPYWIAPAIVASPVDELHSCIDWSVVTACQPGDPMRWSSDVSPQSLLNKFLVDPFDGGKRYFTKAIAENLRSSDVSPLKGPQATKTIMDDSNSLWTKSRRNFVADLTQPVIEADKVLHRRNLLAISSKKEIEQTSECHICPQLLHISKLSTDIVTAGYILPAVIHRIESHLIAQEACDMLGLQINPHLALEALTKNTDAVEEEDKAMATYHKGMGNNYERLEFLGDTFLKMATTLAVHIKNPTASEGESHIHRMYQLCNNNLSNFAVDAKLYEYIRSKAFQRRKWYPAGIELIEGKGKNKDQSSEKDDTHNLAEKTIADVCEALIGAAFLSHNRQHEWQGSDWDQAVRAVTIMVHNDQHNMQNWSDYSLAYTVPKWQLQRTNAAESQLILKVSEEDGYKFNSGRLLHCAFNHPSNALMNEGVPSYQQLEWLGDALIDVVCVSHLMYSYPDKDPGWLTEHKMAMTSNTFLGALCVKLGFHRHIRHTTASLGSQIKQYLDNIAEQEAQADGAVNYWMAAKDPPKALADVVEAYVGALFLDSGFDYGQVMRFFNEHMLHFFKDMTIYDTFANDHPVIKLNRRLIQELGCTCHRIMVDEVSDDGSKGEEVMAGLVIHGLVIGGDHSRSAKYAKGRCAQKALEELAEMSRQKFRERFRCDCKNDDEERVT